MPCEMALSGATAHAEISKKKTHKKTTKTTKTTHKKKTHKKKARTSSKKQPKSSPKKSARKKAGRKSAKKSRKKRSNMPRGWQWPPSKAMEKEGERCLAHLSELGVSWKRVKRVRKVATPIVVADLVFGRIRLEPTFRKPPFVMDCLLAEALTEHSQMLYDQGVRVLRFSSIHSYRKARANGQTSGSLSRHALGLAIDVFEFVMDGEFKVVVEGGYHAPDSVLPGLEQVVNQSGGFRNLLTPGNDPTSHHDHFHFAAHMPRPDGP
jgi:hypothetical protein